MSFSPNENTYRLNNSAPVVTIAPPAAPVAAGEDAVFTLTRTGATDATLTVTVAVTQTRTMCLMTPARCRPP